MTDADAAVMTAFVRRANPARAREILPLWSGVLCTRDWQNYHACITDSRGAALLHRIWPSSRKFCGKYDTGCALHDAQRI